MFSRAHRSVNRLTWLRLVERRTIWCPTLLGALCLGVLFVLPIAWWFICGEAFLSSTGRSSPAEVLVVESWIGYAAIRSAATEFQQHGYQYVVATGGLTDERWADHRWSYAEMAERELVRSGIPSEKIILASSRDTQRQRTFQSAVAVYQALQARNIRPSAINVFTLGPHTSRSRLVFSKVFGSATQVGAVAWIPPNYATLLWWQSSERAKEFLSETLGYAYELLLNSGRTSHYAGSAATAEAATR